MRSRESRQPQHGFFFSVKTFAAGAVEVAAKGAGDGAGGGFTTPPLAATAAASRDARILASLAVAYSASRALTSPAGLPSRSTRAAPATRAVMDGRDESAKGPGHDVAVLDKLAHGCGVFALSRHSARQRIDDNRRYRCFCRHKVLDQFDQGFVIPIVRAEIGRTKRLRGFRL
jgi:hypothetical protein